ncbi:flavin reductase family protein [Streptomyces sulphureus]|uniref:flavin reductase family protein n=1 Tax=Streptomyces sulphureus TaxID=47758 RepID=UPI00037186AD|nr:flavin reductase family protein [Streptomyces sulphureus]
MADTRCLRDVLGRFVTGVVAVTAAGPDGPVGLTANSFTSVSLNPPLVLFCVHRSSRVRQAFAQAGAFGVNILDESQEAVSRQFSRPAEERAGGLTFHRGQTGAPLLTDALAYLDCELEEQIEAGDHIIVLGRVRDHEVQWEGRRPLAFFSGRYTRLHTEEPVPANRPAG